MKKVTFSITVVVLLAMIVGLIGYDRFSTSQNAKKYQLEEKTTTTTKEETTKTKTKKEKNSQRIYCIGDSFTLGSEFASYPLNLESLTNSEIIKFGGNQDTTYDLSIRVGRTKIFANNITIPGDKEAVDLTFYNEKGEQVEALKNSGSNFDEVTIQGIKGTLAYDSSRNIHTFTRDKSGKAVTLTAPAQIEATLPEFNENDIVIIFSGNYDKQNNQDVYRTITYQRAILNQIKTQKYIVVSMTSKRQNNLVRDDNNILNEEHKDQVNETHRKISKMENQATETRVLMHTNKGDIKLKLYNDTPLHRDNFIKLVKEGQYNGLLFHRVIKDFMIQGGDVTSKDAPMNKQLGAGDLGYTVPAEFRYPKYFHKKGALCAARTGDEVNPEKASSASQFYIVTGKKYSEQELNQMEKQLEGRLKQEIFARLQNENKPKIMEFYRSGNKEELAILRDTLIGKTELEAEKRKDEVKLNPELREAYKNVGGVPFLDNQYTVYGEVVEGMDVVDAIQSSKTNKQDRPTENIVINSVEIL